MTIHANTVGDGYWTDISRTGVVGTPREQRSMYKDVGATRRAALKGIVPEISAGNVDAAARSVLTSRGLACGHPTDHEVGFTAADTNPQPLLHPASSDIVEPGMTFNIEPATYIEGVGATHHCDTVACTHTGRRSFDRLLA